MKKQNSNHNVKIEKMVVFVKKFDHYYHKFNFGNFFKCPVKVLIIWNWDLDRNLFMAYLFITIFTVLFEKLITILR